MQEVSLFGCWTRVAPSESVKISESGGAVKKVEAGGGYYIREKDLRDIHRAACRGNVREVQRLLLLHPGRLNDRDRRDRTALHLACACSHLEVVTLLIDRKCELNLQDNMNRTALMKSQEEECMSLLLERGADPNVKDVNGYTALHHAALNGNVALAAKLLQHQADIEATCEDGFTLLMLAVYVKNKEMVEFLIRKNANVNASNNSKRTALMFAVKDESSNTVRLLLQQNVDVSAVDDRGWTAENYASFKTLRINRQLICDYKKERRCKVSSENSNLVYKCSTKDPASSLSCKPGIDDSQSTSQDKNFTVDPKEEPTKPAIGKKENGVDSTESAPQEHTTHDNLPCVDGTQHNNRRVQMSALGLGEEEDVKSPGDSESIPEIRPGTYADRSLFTADQRGKHRLVQQVEGFDEEM